MKILIIPDIEDVLVNVDTRYHYKNGTLTINFSPDFIDSCILEIQTYNPELSAFSAKVYFPVG